MSTRTQHRNTSKVILLLIFVMAAALLTGVGVLLGELAGFISTHYHFGWMPPHWWRWVC